MRKKISIFVPVYSKPKFVQDIVTKFLNNDYPDKEIILIIDGNTNVDIENAIEPIKNRIKMIYNNERLGKSASLEI